MTYMRLTDSTEVRSICGGKLLAVYEPGKPALLIDVVKHSANVFNCSWMVEVEGYEGERYITDCGAQAVGFENGFICENGHSHRTDVEYYEADEAAAYLKAGFALAPNARLMDGSRI